MKTRCSQCKEREAQDLLDGLCRLCDMFVCQKPPLSNTDREFLAGTENGRQFQNHPDMGDFYAGVARKAGVSTTGKVYKGSLARYAGDPQAWISGRGDVQRICEKNGWECEGRVKVKGREPEPSKGVDVDPRLVREYVAKEIPEGVKLSAREKADLTEKVYNRIKPPKPGRPSTRKPKRR